MTASIDKIREALAALREAEKHPDMSATTEHARSMFWNAAEQDAIAELLAAHDAALRDLEAMRGDAWQPLDTAPKDGRYIYVRQNAVYRWLPYKPNSQERQRGKKGRWQRHNGYGFDNAELVGESWQNAEVSTNQQ